MKLGLKTTVMVLLCCFLWEGGAQEFSITRFSLENGLSQSSVSCVEQDDRGFLWIGTQDGLNRYNGSEFEVYKQTPFDTASLSSNYITALCADKNGKIWVGTQLDGLDLFDPRTRQCVHFNQTSPLRLIDNRILAIHQDKWGQVWVATSKGLNRIIAQKKEGIVTYKIDAFFTTPIPGYKRSNVILSIFEDTKNRLWVGTSTGLFYMDNAQKNVGVKQIPPITTDTLTFSVRAIRQDNAGKIWVGTQRGLYKYDIEEKTATTFSADLFGANEGGVLSMILEAKKNTLWVSTSNNHLYGISLNSLPYKREIIDLTPFQSIRNTRIDMLVEDRFQGGIIWAGCFGGGLLKIMPVMRQFITDKLDNPTLYGTQSINALYADSQYVWVGTDKGLYLQDKKNNTVSLAKFIDEKGKVVTTPVLIQYIKKGINQTVWAGTRSGLFYQEKPQAPFKMQRLGEKCNERQIVSYLYEDSEHYLYVSGLSGLNILNPTTQTFLPCAIVPDSALVSATGNRISAMLRDGKNRFWIGTTKGLFLYREVKNPFTDLKIGRASVYMYNPKDTTGLPSNTILSIHEDRKGNIWIGTTAGLLRVRESANQKLQFERYATKQGLTNTTIYGILEDSVKQNLWLSTNGGIYRFNLYTHRFENFDMKDGIQSREFNEGAYVKTRGGELYFGGINGYTRFFPSHIRSDSIPPKVWITAYTDRNGKNHEILYDTDKKIELDYSQNSFIVHFIGIQFNHAEDIFYSYYLIGAGRDGEKMKPTPIGNARQVPFSNLPAGRYTFKVIGANADGLRSMEGDTLEIIIRPPFYQTGWFLILVLLTIGSVLWGLHQLRVQQKVQRVMDMERVRKNAASDFHDELGHKLTVISLFANVVKTSLGEGHKLSEHLDKVINTSNSLYLSMKDLLWVLDPKKDSLYDLALMLKDFGDQLFDKTGVAFRTDGIEDSMKGYNLLMDQKRHITLIFKEVMNNSMKHSRAKNTDLTFLWAEETKHIEIAFHDDGIGFDPLDTSSGNGLLNLQDRANRIGASIDIISDASGVNGTSVVFKMTFAHLQKKQQSQLANFLDAADDFIDAIIPINQSKPKS